MNAQLVAEVQPDTRALKGGGTVVERDPLARIVRLWQYEGDSPTPALIGELFLPQPKIDLLYSARTLLGFVASYAGMELTWAGELPAIAEHPRIPKAVKVLKGLSKMFT